MRLGADGK
jgi:altered-inheritance-of-mitochondria protein 13